MSQSTSSSPLRKRGRGSSSPPRVSDPQTPMRMSFNTDPFQLPTNTPMAANLFSTLPFSTTQLTRDPAFDKVALEMEGKFVGPMPVGTFLEFLPMAPRRLQFTTDRTAKIHTFMSDTQESTLYKKFVEAFKDFCPHLLMVDTHASPCPSPVTQGRDLKPDISLYDRDRLSEEEKRIVSSGNRLTNFSKSELHFELKSSTTDDCFDDSERFDGDVLVSSFERLSAAARQIRGQIASYTAAQRAAQFRTCTFSVLVCGGKGQDCQVRLIRWDAGGAVVSSAMPLNDKDFAEFLWRFSHASPTDRGVDTSIREASNKEGTVARKALNLLEDVPMFRYTLLDDNDDTDHHYIGPGSATSRHVSPAGRGTRGMVVYNPEAETDEERVVWLKDTWRIALDGYEKESDIYKSLKVAGVRHIAPCLNSGDVQGVLHATRTHEFLESPWNLGSSDRQKPIPYRHYRHVLGVVGKSLTNFTSTRELVGAIADGVEAHMDAWENAKILHRDISIGNILIDKNGEGLLIDWEMAKRSENLEKAARRQERSGTWQFMSAKLLLAKPSENVPHTLADDLESFVHVLTWIVLRYTDHGIDPEMLTRTIQNIFDEVWTVKGHYQGGANKRAYLQSNDLVKMLNALKNPCLLHLLESLGEGFAVRYQTRPSVEEILTKQKNITFALPEMQQSMAQNIVAIYESRMENLDTSRWTLAELRRAIQSSDWPDNDRKCQPLTPDYGRLGSIVSRSSVWARIGDESSGLRSKRRRR